VHVTEQVINHPEVDQQLFGFAEILAGWMRQAVW
jgi:hypothetical protein